MKKTYLLIILSMFLISNVIGQVNIEGQIGGSNFLGYSINTGIEIPLSKNKTHFLVPSFGIGALAPRYYGSTTIIHTGLNYKYKKWGVGTEVSGFTSNPFSNNSIKTDFVDMLVYPNLNYSLEFKNNWYLRISLGAYFAFSKDFDNIGGSRIIFNGDIIPGGGISFGYKF